MKHDHAQHHCECKHERLRFCAKCQVPHCLDCGAEWVAKGWNYFYYPNTYPTTTNVPEVTFCGGLSQTYTNVPSGQVTSDTVTQFQGCTHAN